MPVFRRSGLGFVVIAGVAVLAAGCTITGGGWFASPSGGKVAFTVNGTSDEASGDVTGGGDIHDQALGVDAHLVAAGTIEGGPQAFNFFVRTLNCADTEGVSLDDRASEVTLVGQYTPQPKTQGPGGTFFALVQDRGQGRSGQGDFVAVELFGGVFDGYFSCGIVQGGNFNVK